MGFVGHKCPTYKLFNNKTVWRNTKRFLFSGCLFVASVMLFKCVIGYEPSPLH